MHRTGWLPLLLSAAVYAVLSAAHPIAAVDGAMLGELAQAFDLSLWTVLPALLILVLPLCRVPVRWSMAASVAAAFLVTVAQQRMPALQALRAGSDDFVIQTGDAMDYATTLENGQSFFPVVNQKNLNGTALVHALGNHEYMGDSDGEVSGNIFDLPQSEPNLWYAVEYGDVCVVVVNHQSEGAPNGSLVDATAEIAEKLKTDCSWKVLVTHMPVYGTEGVLPEASIKAIAANLEKAGIDFVFSGDDNSYTRTYPMIGNVKQPENSSKARLRPARDWTATRRSSSARSIRDCI